jgi:hypothetical protein
MIKEKGYTTYVENAKHCFSSCGIIWLSGSKRYISAGAKVGFHSIYFYEKDKNGKRTNKKVRDDKANEALGRYYASLGLSSEAIKYLVSTEPDDLKFLTEKDATRMGITATTIEDEQITGVKSPPNHFNDPSWAGHIVTTPPPSSPNHFNDPSWAGHIVTTPPGSPPNHFTDPSWAGHVVTTPPEEFRGKRRSPAVTEHVDTPDSWFGGTGHVWVGGGRTN